MFGLSGSRPFQQCSPRELSAFTNCMIAPVEHGQCESLPASINPCRVSTNLGFNEFGFSGLPDRGLPVEGNGSIRKLLPQIQTVLQNQGHGEKNSMFPAKVGEKPSACELPSQQKKLLIFDRSGSETRLIFSSLCRQLENRKTPRSISPAWNVPEESVGAYHHYLAQKQGRIAEQAWTRTPALCEESGENEIIDEVSEMREDSDEINALLYSDDDDDDDDDDDHSLNDDRDDDDDEVSSGHSPFERDYEKQDDEKDFDNEVASKRQKTLHGGCKRLHQHPSFEDINDGDLISTSKRQRKDKIHDTLKVLESIIPGLKSKDPLIILEEAINYLKCLKYNAQAMSMEDQLTVAKFADAPTNFEIRTSNYGQC